MTKMAKNSKNKNYKDCIGKYKVLCQRCKCVVTKQSKINKHHVYCDACWNFEKYQAKKINEDDEHE